MNLSIIIPIFNYEKNIEANFLKIQKIFAINKKEPEFILVDDGSTDSTWNILKEIKLKHKKIQIIKNDINLGKGGSIKIGIKNSSKNNILFTDCDLAYPVDQIYKISNFFFENQCQIVCANRRHSKSRFFVFSKDLKYVYKREIIGRVFNIWIRFLGLSDQKDTQSGLKIFKKNILNFDNIKEDRFLFDVEFLYSLKKLNINIDSIPIDCTYENSYTSISLLKSIFLMFIGTIILKIKK